MTSKPHRIFMDPTGRVTITKTNPTSPPSKELKKCQLRPSFGTVISPSILESIVMYTLILGNSKFGF